LKYKVREKNKLLASVNLWMINKDDNPGDRENVQNTLSKLFFSALT